MTDYTPTTNEIRADFITLHTRNFDSYTVGRSLASEQEVYGDAFDRMIAAVERAAAERALTEAAEIAEALDFGPAPPFSRASAHQWGARQAAVRIRARAAEYRKAVQ